MARIVPGFLLVFFCLFYVENRLEEPAEYWNGRVKGRKAGALGPKGAVDPCLGWRSSNHLLQH